MTKKEQKAIEVAARKVVNIQNKAIREAEKVRKTAATAERIQQTLLRRVTALEDGILLGITTTIKKHGVSYITPQAINIWGREIGQAIYDMGPVWSGYLSTTLQKRIDAGESFSKIRTPEHFFPRQIAGETVVKHVIKYSGITRSHLLQLLEKFRMVHYVTSEENTALVPFQKGELFEGWEITYRQANIDLIHSETGESYDQHQRSLAAVPEILTTKVVDFY